MSLLLDALKKAELAKQGTKIDPTAAPDIDLSDDMGQPREPSISPAAPVVTRGELPDISSSLEILSPDLERETPRPADPEPDIMEQTLAAPAMRAGLPPRQSQLELQPELDAAAEAERMEAAERRAAQQVFEAKEMDLPHPRRPFFITIGVLLACGAGYSGYLWWQLQPRTVYNTAAIQAAAAQAAAAPAPATTAAATPPAEPAAPDANAAPGTAADAPAAPGAAPAPAPASAPARVAGAPVTNTPAPPKPAAPGAAPRTATSPAAPAPVASTRAPSPVLRPAPRAPSSSPTQPAASVASASGASRAAQKPEPPPIQVTPSVPTIDPLADTGYAAFQRGDFAQARDAYQRLLTRESTNRDALLGLAAIDMRNGEYAFAQSRYLRLLELDPRDAHAQAGLAALRGQADPVGGESRIKSLIAAQPEVPDLHFALGNQLAAQSRWSEAQVAYFKAFTLDATNPDFAFNLAVSLDQIRQPRQALEYYRRALSLANSRSAAFNPAGAQTRIKELAALVP